MSAPPLHAGRERKRRPGASTSSVDPAPALHYPSPVSRKRSAGPSRPGHAQIRRAYRLLNRSLEDFYQANYEHAIQRCAEALDQLLPGGPDPSASPEERGRRFLQTFAAVLPAREADEIARVFTFFQSRVARFRLPRGRPLPERDWWRFVRISREEADQVLRATRLTLNAIEEARSPRE